MVNPDRTVSCVALIRVDLAPKFQRRHSQFSGLSQTSDLLRNILRARRVRLLLDERLQGDRELAASDLVRGLARPRALALERDHALCAAGTPLLLQESRLGRVCNAQPNW